MKKPKVQLAIVLAVALVARIAVALLLGNEVSGLSGAFDEITYNVLGHRYAAGYGLTFPENWYPWIEANAPQSYFSASQSLLLAGIYIVFGYYPIIARLIFALLGVIIVWLIYILARRFFGDTVAFVSGLVAAVYNYLVFYSVTLVTETPFILFILISLLIAIKLRDSDRLVYWFLLGLSLAATVLFRMAIIFFVPFLILWVLYARRKFQWRALIPFAMIVLAVMPFTIHNYKLWGRFMVLESQFGHVFWNGNHPDHHGNFHPYKVFPIPEEVLASKNDAIITSELLKMGIQNVLNDPWNFVMLTLTRLREFFTFWPTSDSGFMANLLRVTSFGLMWPFAVGGLYLARKQWRDLLPIFLFMLLHTGVYAVSWTMVRYRVPLDAVLIPFAAVALVYLYNRYSVRFRKPRPTQST